MTAPEIYTHETGRESHARSGAPHPAYVEWLERIVCKAAGMLNVIESKDSIYDHYDIEELAELFSRHS